MVTVLFHSAWASGNKWYHWVILAKLGDIVLNFLHNFSMPNCINSWRETTLVDLPDPMINTSSGPCSSFLPFRHLLKFITIKWSCSTQWFAGNPGKSSQYLNTHDYIFWAKQYQEILTLHKIHLKSVKLSADSSLGPYVISQKGVTMTVLKASFLTHPTHHESAKKKSKEYDHLFLLFQIAKQYNEWH